MPVPYGSKLDIPATKYYLLAAQKEPYKKVYSLTKNIDEFYGGPHGEVGGGGGGAEKWTINRKITRQKEQQDSAVEARERDRKRESNDSPEIPDKTQTSTIPGFPSGEAEKKREFCNLKRERVGGREREGKKKKES